MNLSESIALYRGDAERHAQNGIHFPDVRGYIPDGARRDYTIAMDAQPQLFSQPNSAIPAVFTTLIDPEVFRILYTPNKAAEIWGEKKKGSWLDSTAVFQVVEQVGEVSSYGDYNENGHVGVNTNWPQRQNYLYQTIKEYGQRELELAGLARLNYVAELDAAAATVMNKFLNLTYFFGVAGLQNYGSLNDPSLGPALTPSTKAYGGVKWVVNGVVVADALEIFRDIQTLYGQLVTQSGGLIDQDTEIVLAISPAVAVAMTATNSFGVNVTDLLKKNFPKIRIETAVQFGAQSAANPQGVVGGNFVQMFAKSIEGQETGFAAFSEKMRAFPIVVAMSSFKQKVAGGTWGSVIRMPVAVASMIGV